MIEFHFCRSYKEKVEGLDSSITQKIYKKFQEYEKRDNLNNIGNIEPLIRDTYILKTKQPNSRIIIQVEEIDNVKVHFVRDIITNVKFDREYGRIIYGKIKKGEWLQENPLLEDEINLFKTNYITKSQKEVTTELLYPPGDLINWFSQFELTLNNEIFESKDWVAYALNNSIQSGMRENYTYLFRSELEKIINNKRTCPESIDNNIKTFVCENNNIGIIYSIVKLKDKVYYLLHFGAHIEEQKEYWSNCLNELNSLEDLIINTEDDLYRYSFRSYPKWTLNKESLWYKITKSEENSNLSLTTEQVEFLKTFKFPCYINGQAGSGKSTLLYYIFANIIYLKNLDSIKGDIIFLTENEQLLTNSSNNVLDLLENNPEFELSHEEIIENKKHFHSFKNFLLNMLDESDLENFKDDMYLHFPIFKVFYENSTIKSPIVKEYSAEEAWFVISTYIYGHDISQKITSKTYEDEVYAKSRKIDTDRFIDIETYILPFYESLLEKGYWDKLKIIRYIDQNINLELKTKYEVIICDEAQDFCKVELSFILKQSSYLKYNLSSIDQIPIVFAGDANQTVNPTGFSDAEMTSLLYQELQEINFQYKSKDTFYSTNLNYRSNSQVVSLANFIQYYRIKHLDLTSNKKPQESKRPLENSVKTYNIFLDYETIENTPKLKNALFEKLKYKIFIIPTNSEEKKEFKENSLILSNFKDLEIKTSVESKGAEYKQVVLYGFGEYFLEHFEFNNQKNNFQVMYYFNKLYVAITRAKTELIIIDSKKSKEYFWEQLICKAEIPNQNSWSKLKDVQSSVLLYNPDSINNIILDSTKEDALENAKEDEKLGINYQNPARLKIAASQFSRLSKQNEAYKCLGFSEEINHNYKIAAEYFQKAEELELASNSFFKGRFFNDLTAFGINLQDISHDIRVILSRLMLGEFITYKEIQELNTHKKIVFFTINDLLWRDDFIRIFVSFLEKNKHDKDFINHLIEIGTYIGKDSDKELYKEIASIHFIQSNYKDAIENWEKIDDYSNENYYMAKYEYYKRRKDIVNKIIFLNELIKFKDNNSTKIEIYNEIIDNYIEYESVEEKDSNHEFYLVVFKAFVITDDFNYVINLNKFLKMNVYPSELEECYKLIIIEHIVSKKMFNFIILEWAKIIVSHEEFDNLLLENVNNIYKEKASIYSMSFSPYTVAEIEKFINSSDEFEISPSEHLSHISISNFRQFDNLSLDNLGRFNLIVGDNNVGKTSLLEALLFVNNEELFYKNLAFAFIARNNTNLIRKEDNQIKFDLPKDFIVDFFRNNDSSIPMKFELQEKRQQWNYSFRTPTIEEVIREKGINLGIDENDYISVTIDQNKIKLNNLLNLVININPSEIIKMQFIPFGKGFDKNLAKSFYETIYRDKSKRELFENSMKVFIPNIDKIMVDTSIGKIEIEESDKKEVFSLHQYGEGANKLFRILVQIIIQKDKKLLIDEIDAGIHYSHFSEFWNVILKVAYENNVQLFVTTHNLECIEYFKNTIEKNDEYQNISNIITIAKLNNNGFKAYIRSYEEFSFELDNNFEIRGENL